MTQSYVVQQGNGKHLEERKERQEIKEERLWEESRDWRRCACWVVWSINNARRRRRDVIRQLILKEMSVVNNGNSINSPDSSFSTESSWMLLWLPVSSFSWVLASSATVTGPVTSPSGLCTVVNVFHQLDNAPRAWDRAPPVHIHNIYYKYIYIPLQYHWGLSLGMKGVRPSVYTSVDVIWYNYVQWQECLCACVCMCESVWQREWACQRESGEESAWKRERESVWDSVRERERVCGRAWERERACVHAKQIILTNSSTCGSNSSASWNHCLVQLTTSFCVLHCTGI
jgi:hypothetical protein